MKQFFSLFFLIVLTTGVSSFALGAVYVQNIGDTARHQPLMLKKDSIPQVIGIKVVRAITAGESKEKGLEPNELIAFPEEIVEFTISNPRAFLGSRPTDRSRVVIYGNGIELNGICTDWYESVSRLNINADHLAALSKTADIDIILRRNDTTQAAWNFFYSNGNNIREPYADIHASIGWEGMSPLENISPVQSIRFYYYHKWIFWLWVSVFIVIVAGFLFLALKTGALRDSKPGPYSLSRTNLFFWTLLVVGAFIYTLVLTDVASAMNGSVLMLLGVSIVTNGGAEVIDVIAAKKISTDVPDIQSENFIMDILSDRNGFSIQRIQVFVWNLVLGVYFVIYTVLNKTMPEFSNTLLFLAGISSLSYLGNKTTQNTNAAKQE